MVLRLGKYAVVILLSLVFGANIFAQNDCSIAYNMEPVMTTQVSLDYSVSQTESSITIPWQEAPSSTNSTNFIIDFETKKISNILTFRDLVMQIPLGSTIHGIQVAITGYSDGDGYIKDRLITIGNEIGSTGNKAGEGYNDKNVWYKGQSRTWYYGGELDTWGKDWTAAELNDPDFGIHIQIRNFFDKPISASIENVELQVFFTPPASFCEYGCPVFYVEKQASHQQYSWYLPDGIGFTNKGTNDYIIDLHATTDAEAGLYEICLDIETTNGPINCCRDFLYEKCTPSTIGDFIWSDDDGDGIQDIGEAGVEGVRLDLIDEQNTVVQSVTSGPGGKYSFQNVDAGRYRIRIFPSQTQELTIPNSTSDDADSDFDNSGYSSFFVVGYNEVITHIDAGLITLVDVKGSAWEDTNADGQFQNGEIGLENINVKLLDQSGTVLSETKTALDGQYCLTGVRVGVYYIQFEIGDSSYLATLQDVGLELTDSDVNSDFTTALFFVPPTGLQGVNAGVVRNASIAGEVWLDENCNGNFDNGEDHLEGIVIQIFDQDWNAIGTTTSDDKGYYSFDNLYPQSYEIIIGRVDELTASILGDNVFIVVNDTITTGILQLISGEINTDVNAGLIPYRGSICGFTFFDYDYNGLYESGDVPIGGQTVILLDSNNFEIESIKMGVDGTYCFDSLIPGDYQLQFNKLDFQLFSPSMSTNLDINSDVDDTGFTDVISVLSGKKVDNISAGYGNRPSIGDLVWLDENADGLYQSNEQGLEGVKVYLYNILDELIDSTISDANGSYMFEFIEVGDYYLKADANRFLLPSINMGGDPQIDSDFTDLFGPFTTGVISADPNVFRFDVDLGFIIPNVDICGIFWLDENSDGLRGTNEVQRIAGIELQIIDSNNNVIGTTFTDIDGRYCFESIPEGEYRVVIVSDISKFQLTEPNVGFDDTVDSDFQKDLNTELITVIYGNNYSNIDAGFTKTSIIGDFIWLDDNKNGIQDTGEGGLGGEVIYLYDESGQLIDSTLSDNMGLYRFVDVREGNYYVSFKLPEGLQFTIKDADPLKGSKPDSSGITDVFEVRPNEDKLDIDAGLVLPTGSIMGVAWEDTDIDGQRDANENLLLDIDVELYNENDQLVAIGTTSPAGMYVFLDVVPGNYYLVFESLPLQPFTLPLIGNPDTDSDVTSSTGVGHTDIFTLMPNENIMGIDAGYEPKGGIIKGITWLDDEADGIRSPQEVTISDVVVTLYTIDSIKYADTDVDSQGYYEFTNIPVGDYYIVFEPIEDCYLATSALIGQDTTVDSDITETYFFNSTNVFTITNGAEFCNVDGGFIGMASFSGSVFVDRDTSGIQENGENGLADVIVQLVDAQGVIVSEDTTNMFGEYLFDKIFPGNYVVQVIRPMFYSVSQKDIGSNDTIDNDFFLFDDMLLVTDTIFAKSKSRNEFIDAGVYYDPQFNSSLSGEVWLESEINGTQEAAETLVEGIRIELIDNGGNVVSQAFSNSAGRYEFVNQMEGFYTLRAYINEQQTATFPLVGNDPTIDCDFLYISKGIVEIPMFYLGVNEMRGDLDLGVTESTTIGDFVWKDSIYNGIQDVNEPGFEGISLILFHSSGFQLMTKTDSNGKYLFEGLPGGVYDIQMNIPLGWSTTTTKVGGSDTDNDFDQVGLVENLTLIGGAIELGIDGGLVENGSIGDFVFVDFNGNGRQNSGEPGLSGVLVTLYNEFGDLISSMQTMNDQMSNEEGFYRFSELRPGKYYVVFDLPQDYNFTDPGTGQEFEDSDVTSSIVAGSTDLIDLQPGEINTDIDAGIFIPGVLGDFVWDDLDGDGQQDFDEPGIGGVSVNLLRFNGLPLASTTTNSNGEYQFAGLKQGLYIVEFPEIAQYSITTKDNTNSDENDSDADPVNRRTSLVSLAHGVTFLDVDCGYVNGNSANDFDRVDQLNIGHKKTKDLALEVRKLFPRPNPAVFETTFSVEEKGEYLLRILDQSGRVVKTAHQEVSDDKIISLNTRDLHPGWYTIQLIGSDIIYKGTLIRVY